MLPAYISTTPLFSYGKIMTTRPAVDFRWYYLTEYSTVIWDVDNALGTHSSPLSIEEAWTCCGELRGKSEMTEGLLRRRSKFVLKDKV